MCVRREKGALKRIRNYKIDVKNEKKIALLNESRLYLLHLDGAKVWQDQGRLPICDLNMLLSRYIDITTPPTQRLLALMASHAVDEDDKRRLQLLATVK